MQFRFNRHRIFHATPDGPHEIADNRRRGVAGAWSGTAWVGWSKPARRPGMQLRAWSPTAVRRAAGATAAQQ